MIVLLLCCVKAWLEALSTLGDAGLQVRGGPVLCRAARRAGCSTEAFQAVK
jgi:hypothetical protein